ncbi:MAG: hypothetical protein KAJ66_03485 [Candidatus Omnitrophica bacterium]|nr:hypothetical protein [Candidatus Omnitrophota bacterium]
MMKVYNLLLFLLIYMFFTALNIFASDDKFVYNSHNKRDPFIAPGSALGQKEDEGDREPGPIDKSGAIKLEGIVYDPRDGSRIIIDGRVMKVGDKTDFFEVKRIDRDRVILDVLGEKKIVKLKQAEGAKPDRGNE